MRSPNAVRNFAYPVHKHFQTTQDELMNSFDKSPEMQQEFMPVSTDGHQLNFSAQKDEFKQPAEHLGKVTIDPRMLIRAGRNQQPLLLQETKPSTFIKVKVPSQGMAALTEHYYGQAAPMPKTKKKEIEKHVENSPTEEMTHST